jgi:hypothetical protein
VLQRFPRLAKNARLGAGYRQNRQRRNPSRVTNECRQQRIFDALVNSLVEDKRVSAFSSFIVGETTPKPPTSPFRVEQDTVAFQG